MNHSNLENFDPHAPESPELAAASRNGVAPVKLDESRLPDGAKLAAERPRAFRRDAFEYAQERAELLAGREDRTQSLRELDRAFSERLRRDGDIFDATPGLRASLEHFTSTVFHGSVARLAPECVRGLGEAIGHDAVSRRVDLETLQERDNEARDYLKRFGASPHLEAVYRDSLRKGMKRGVYIEECSVDLHRHLNGIVKDPAAAGKIIARIEPHERRRLADSYEERYDVDLTRELRAKFGGAGRALVLHLLRGEDLQAQADKLYLALRQPFGDRAERVAEILSVVPLERRPEFEECFQAYYGKHLRRATFTEAVERYVRVPEDREYLAHLWAGRELDTQVALAHRLLHQGTVFTRARHFTAIVRLLEEFDSKSFNNFQVEYCTRFGIAFDEDVLRARIPRECKECLRAFDSFYFHGDTFEVELMKLRCGLSGIHKPWLGELAIGSEPAQLSRLVHAYEERFKRNFDKDYRRITQTNFAAVRFLFGDEYEAVRDLFRNGTLSKAELVAHCMFGPGVDGDGVKAILKGISVEEASRLGVEYAHRFPGRNLESDVGWEMFGDDRFDAEQLLRGKPSTLMERYNLMLGRLDYEFAGPLATGVRGLITSLTDATGPLLRRVPFIGGLFDGFRSEAHRVRKDADRLHEFYEKEIVSERGGEMRALSFEGQIRRVGVGAEAFRRAKNAIADFCTNTIANSGAAAAMFVTQAGLHILPLTFIAGGLTSLGIRFAVKWGVKGPAYGLKEMAIDGLRSCVAGSNLLTGRISARQIIQGIIGTMTKTGLSTLVDFSSRLRIKEPSAHVRALTEEELLTYDTGPEQDPERNGGIFGIELLAGHDSFRDVWRN